MYYKFFVNSIVCLAKIYYDFIIILFTRSAIVWANWIPLNNDKIQSLNSFGEAFNAVEVYYENIRA